MAFAEPTITEEQRSAMKPWAIGIFVVEVAMIASLIILALNPSVASDLRLFGVWISLTWLIGRSFQDYCNRRMAMIVGESWPSETGREPFYPLLSFRRVTTILMLTILIVSVAAFFL